MAKTNKEIEYYRVLRNKMMVKAEILNVNWARYYANLLDLGGVNNEQYLKNFFNDDNKRFNSDQLSTILLDLENVKNIEVIGQCQMQNEVLKVVKEIGVLSGEMEKQFDNKDEIETIEANRILPKARNLLVIVEKLVFRLEETKARG
ncbi:hypothetical protein QUR76_06815 [Arcobacter cryaerophilus gv. pseudocryaerophilus]|uniref:Uncharacterized protein n=3 Tax=unclassified Arcobacter TaxID=2593671 RepID=A0AA96IDI6_9BACT|nr:hypothetical protein RMQ65_01280 [Arcobacter sp. AZ-2023]WPD04837.1 hypothetical protein QUR76_06815 [Arcobacter sp. DSM 115956]WPD06932.1 hypothetical protein QUR78_06815 [Arcobacter sp. DSM 115955]WNL31197.1 hypothetical protein RMQ67_06815 [Arcobacter sp. AZ-2023]WNP37347.1 hypothetical protein RJG58_06815 [Arcobacter sp. AZ-2023]